MNYHEYNSIQFNIESYEIKWGNIHFVFVVLIHFKYFKYLK